MTDRRNSLNRILVTVGAALAAIGVIALLLAARADPEPTKSAPAAVPEVATITVPAGPESESTLPTRPLETISSLTGASIADRTTAQAESPKPDATVTTSQTSPVEKQPTSVIVKKDEGLSAIAFRCGINANSAAERVELLVGINGWSGLDYVPHPGDIVHCVK